MSCSAPVLRRKAGNQKALFISPGSPMRQMYRPLKRISPGWLNLWQIDGHYVGSMLSQERKQRRFPFILPILLTACFPSQDLLDFPLPGQKVQGGVGSQQLKSTSCHSCWSAQSAPSTGLPSAGFPEVVIKIISSTTDPPYIWLSSLPFWSPG